jgi:ElaB/YqjD/DUF883 family membrane-anchored ribosome-binding protein
MATAERVPSLPDRKKLAEGLNQLIDKSISTMTQEEYAEAKKDAEAYVAELRARVSKP